MGSIIHFLAAIYVMQTVNRLRAGPDVKFPVLLNVLVM